MKNVFEARAEARKNRQNIIDVKVSRAIEVIEAKLDHAIEKGHFGFSVDLSKFQRILIRKSKKRLLIIYLCMITMLNGLTVTLLQ